VARGYAMPHALDMSGFYEQAPKPVAVCSEILRHVPKVKELLATGTPCPYIPLDTSVMLEEPFPAVMERFATPVEADDIPLARLIFALNKRRFAGKPGFSALGTRLGSGVASL
jgi:hypothetical protein